MPSSAVAQVEAVTAPVAEATAGSNSFTAVLAWIIAGLAAIALLFAAAYDVNMRRRTAPATRSTLEPQPVQSKS